MGYRVAVIGAGIIAGSHLKAMLGRDDLAPCAVADIALDRANALAAEHGIPSYADYKEMIEKERPDIAVVTLPHFLHREAACFAAARGCHIMLEKPMAMSVSECDEIIEAVYAGGVKLMVGHTQHYDAANLAAKAWIDGGRLGRLTMINDRRHQRYDTPTRPAWFFEKDKAGGGILTNLGSHSIDKILWMTGERIARVTASIRYADMRGDIEGGGSALLVTESGIPATLSQSGYPGAVVDETEFRFTGGCMKLLTGRGLWVSDGGDYEQVNVPPQPDPFVRQFEDLIGAIRDNREPECSMAYSRSVVAVVESLYRSHERGAETAVER
ncbi:Gfo/Idh/MocA family protein [Cohnella sp. GCM10012308]|uniref:Gfo/Idh/MocA family protein n=1 Tax=Cohnella sp. GCM10012308 TaxID=3317329 RepID=UPI0036234278